ncbi:hypothetical protein [Pedobacter endophyticus]|uniref:Uncharacterized protein n=1 Tax=Pedobacter endophyticus TaxID=2789740 RepID=A0A7U3Q488_9SPHI|nr:hypothetical protein [Pedobacter endophyticus]QPH38278.1 hypothetical protein IZT61_14400 [Pedobacter endophyticus]
MTKFSCHSERSEESASDGMQNANKPLAKKGSELIKANAESVRDASYLSMTKH